MIYRNILDTILLIQRTGCQWRKMLPCEYLSGSSCHRRFHKEWIEFDILGKYGLGY